MNICTLSDLPIVLTTSSNGVLFLYDASFNEKPPSLIKSISLKKLYINHIYKNYNGNRV